MLAMTMTELPRAVVDTNLWISGFINRRGIPYRLIQAFVSGRFIAVVSQYLLDEFLAVSDRPNIRRRTGLTDEERDHFAPLLRR